MAHYPWSLQQETSKAKEKHSPEWQAAKEQTVLRERQVAVVGGEGSEPLLGLPPFLLPQGTGWDANPSL